MDNAPFISICILSYNRPETLRRLLHTIDATCTNNIEVVVCEDCSPRQKEIRSVVIDFASTQLYPVRYFENERNLGYDGTFNQLVQHAEGRWLVFMGDDDEFVAQAFDKMYAFLKVHPDLGYVMKSHFLIHTEREGKVSLFSGHPTFSARRRNLCETFSPQCVHCRLHYPARICPSIHHRTLRRNHAHATVSAG